jgi:hypothetical protein
MEKGGREGVGCGVKDEDEKEMRGKWGEGLLDHDSVDTGLQEVP